VPALYESPNSAATKILGMEKHPIEHSVGGFEQRSLKSQVE